MYRRCLAIHALPPPISSIARLVPFPFPADRRLPRSRFSFFARARWLRSTTVSSRFLRTMASPSVVWRPRGEAVATGGRADDRASSSIDCPNVSDRGLTRRASAERCGHADPCSDRARTERTTSRPARFPTRDEPQDDPSGDGGGLARYAGPNANLYSLLRPHDGLGAQRAPRRRRQLVEGFAGISKGGARRSP